MSDPGYNAPATQTQTAYNSLPDRTQAFYQARYTYHATLQTAIDAAIIALVPTNIESYTLAFPDGSSQSIKRRDINRLTELSRQNTEQMLYYDRKLRGGGLTALTLRRH
jgi:hypothetical protein